MADEEQRQQEDTQALAPKPEKKVPVAKSARVRSGNAGSTAPRIARARKSSARVGTSTEEAASGVITEKRENVPEGVEPQPPKRPARTRPTSKSQVQLAKPRLETRYLEEIQAALIREFGYGSSMQAPRPAKVVLNMGLGEALTNARALEAASEQLGVITGQRPVITKARRSVAAFKVREGQSIGCMVTLRGRRMYEFLDRLINVALPRIRDFRGVSRTAFDGQGNFSLGLREQGIFPELAYGSIDRSRGLQVTITTTARNDREGFRLLELMGLPFAREGQTR